MKIRVKGEIIDLKGRAARTVRAQPGYIPRREMVLSRTLSGGIRLFVSVSGRWQDASLCDIDPADLPEVEV